MPQTLSEIAARIQADFTELIHAIGTTPSPDLLVNNLTDIKTIEAACNTKAVFDSLIAYSTEQAINDNLIHATTAIDFLMEHLGLSYHEARTRLQRGHTDHAPLTGENTELAEKQRSQARDEAISSRIGASKLNIVNKALGDLREGTTPSKQQLYLQGVEEAGQRTERDLKNWMSKAVRHANNSLDPDPLAGMDKRRLGIHEQDTHGNHPFSGVMTAAQQATIMAAISPLATLGSLVSCGAKDDTRTLGQRRIDALTYICEQYLKNKKPNPGNYGIASLVISVTAAELAQLTATTELPTNTGTLLNPAEAAALLGSQYDFLAIHDLENPANLQLHRSRRNANAWQKLALFVQELVCSHPECDAPAIICDQHHIKAWSFGGTTDLINLTLQCRHHHRFNDDNQKGGRRKGHARRQTDGDQRVGYAETCGSTKILLNSTAAHDECAAEKLRKRRP